jgi:Raf kinase inhibitor-like YbhB/YbcL family protein
MIGAPAGALADPAAPGQPAKLARRAKATLKVTSSAFAANQAIPAEYTCDGTQASPPLTWSAVPKETRSIAVLVDDPDAPGGTFTHLLITGITPDTTALANGGALPAGAVAAKNGKGDVGYTPPCPPTGRHRYVFKVYALETTIPPPATKDDFMAAITGHVLADGQLIGTYQKTAK